MRTHVISSHDGPYSMRPPKDVEDRANAAAARAVLAEQDASNEVTATSPVRPIDGNVLRNNTSLVEGVEHVLRDSGDQHDFILVVTDGD